MQKIVSAFIAAIFSFGPSSLDRTKHLFIHEPIEIEIEQSAPALQALRTIQTKTQQVSVSPTVLNEDVISVPLVAGSEDRNTFESKQIASKVRGSTQDDLVSVSDLSYPQKVRLEMAQKQYGVLDSDWSEPSLSSALEEALKQIPEELKQPEKAQSYLAPNQVRIRGPLEIEGGLAVTDVNRIEVKRQKEGVGFETGSVNLRDGVYEIVVNSFEGSLRAKLVDGSGQVLGEDTVRLGALARQGQIVAGPPLRLRPNRSFGGRIYGKDNRNSNPGQPNAQNFSVSAVDGNLKGSVADDGTVSFPQLAKDSQTIAAIVEDKFEMTQLSIDESFEVEYLNEKTMELMLEFVNQQRLSEKKVFARDGRVIYGRVKGTLLSSASSQVIIEGLPEKKPIYFNDFYLPDLKQKNLSQNGYFLFVDVPPGFYSLAHRAGSQSLGYANVIVAPQTVASVTIRSELPKVEVPLRYFDAFTGYGLKGEVLLQGSDEPIMIQSEQTTVKLRSFETFGIAEINPAGADYVATLQSYSEKDEYLHFPSVSSEWLTRISEDLRVSKDESKGTVIGFVPFSNFKVYLVDENRGTEVLAYFDYKGDLTSDQNGPAGGGFIITDLPKGVVEIVIEFEDSEQMRSRVIPIQSDRVSVVQVK